MNLSPFNTLTFNARKVGTPVPPDNPTAENFAQALREWWAAQGLDVSVGPLKQARVGASEAAPTATFKINKGSSNLLTSTSKVREYRLTFCLRDVESSAAHAKAMLVADAYENQTLIWAGGWAAKPTQQGWPSMAEAKLSPTSTGAPAYAEEIEYTVRIKGLR